MVLEKEIQFKVGDTVVDKMFNRTGVVMKIWHKPVSSVTQNKLVVVVELSYTVKPQRGSVFRVEHANLSLTNENGIAF